MASVSKLSIRGVRSFSPEDAEQVIEFYFPCTIIVGANGCGKTTIIESLKYAVCGALPPGNRSGQAFVHDPRSIGLNQVNANVKLRFTGRNGKSKVVVRSMELTQKKKSVTFKQLHGVVRTTHPETGERVSLSYTPSELDETIPQDMGVSRAVLEHVIFCHQEDASWPLMEGAVLKKRFDEIFDSTRYTKALEVFKKTEKDFLSQVKELRTDLASLASFKHSAEGFRRDLGEQNEQIEVLDDEKKDINASLAETEEALKIWDEIKKLENKVSLCEATIIATLDMCTTDLTNFGAVELQNMLSKQTRSVFREGEYQEAKKELESMNKEVVDLERRIAKSQVEQARQKVREFSRNRIKQDLIQRFLAQHLSSAAVPEDIDIDAFYEILQVAEEELEDKVQGTKAELFELEKSIEALAEPAELCDTRNEITKLKDRIANAQQPEEPSHCGSIPSWLQRREVDEVTKEADKLTNKLAAAISAPQRKATKDEIFYLKREIRKMSSHDQGMVELMRRLITLFEKDAEMSDDIIKVSAQAAQWGTTSRQWEDTFAVEQEAADRKTGLMKYQKSLKRANAKETMLQGIYVTKKEDMSTKCSLLRGQYQVQRDMLACFSRSKDSFNELTKEINKYAASTGAGEYAQAVVKCNTLSEQIKIKQSELDSVGAPDQDVTGSIAILEHRARIIALEEQVTACRSKLKDPQESHEQASEREVQQKASQDYTEGRWSEMVEQSRTLKRKLLAEEYDGVDERHRVCTIKVETTRIAAEDLKKYYTAFDKALHQFHSVKLAEINKIIRELWLLTYKGEDIDNIELESGQESDSRAAKSYNYRVVMTKGSTKLDMRGRCSAGQRVLACTVIRFALAETFGVNCGCIALDEPTVNLDFRNKKSLAIALAQIISSRAQQRNFQLILITHDEEFVSLMKTELSTQTGFSMPDKYFQVRREQAADGKFYSKIDAIDWDELV